MTVANTAAHLERLEIVRAGRRLRRSVRRARRRPLELVVWCDDVDRETARLSEAGSPVLVEPYDHIAGHRRACLADPDGHRIALVDAR